MHDISMINQAAPPTVSTSTVEKSHTRVAALSKNLRAGSVFRRDALLESSTAVDRHLKQLQEMGRVQKLSQGLYYVPRSSAFGALPPDDHTLVTAFLKDEDFLIFSPSSYNALGLGTTQLYNLTLVYNHKRHGTFTFGSRTLDFRVKPRFPKQLTPEFLFVDFLNNLAEFPEERAEVLARAKRRAIEFDQKKLHQATKYANVSTQKLLRGWLNA